MSRFTDAAKRAVTNSFVTVGREKVSIEDIMSAYPNGITIIAFDKMKKGSDEFYSVAFKEDPNAFFFSGSVLSSILDEIGEMVVDGDYAALSKELESEGGIKIKMHMEKSEKTNRNYVACDIID